MRAPRRWPVLLLVLVAAGCGGDSTDEEAGGGLTTGETTSTVPAAQGEGSIGDATFAEEGGEEEVLAGAAPITPRTTEAIGDRPLPRCTDDTIAVTPETRTRAEASAVCLVNRVRRRHGRRALRNNATLYEAAQKHASDMVQGQYFSHVSRGGTTASARIRSAGFPSGAPGSQVGENIAWGTGTFSTPAAIVQSWMNSPGHRQNILRRSFREAGLSIAVGAPVPASGDAGTYVQAFGRTG